MTNDLAKLIEPFSPDEVEFRAGATNDKNNPTKALALAYITSRAVMDRLDSVVGPDGWQDSYQAGPVGGVLCGISIKIDDKWITKWDGADNTNIEGVKGGLSDSFKRAAVKWGIGRYLYSIPSVWVKCEKKGNYVKIDENEARQKMFGNQPQKPQVNQETGEVIEGKPATNGKPKNSNATTRFWTKANELEIDRTYAKELYDQHGPELAIELLEVEKQ